MPVHTVGKIGSVFNHVGIDHEHPGATTPAAIARRRALIGELDHGLVFTNLVETDQVYGHRQDVAGLPRRAAGDRRGGGGVAARARPASATCSCSPPTTASTRRRPAPTTRASTSPLLAAFAGHGGRRHDGPFADVGACVLRWLTGRDAAALPGTPSCDRACRTTARRRSPLRCGRCRPRGLAALALAGCGGGDGDTPAPAAKPAERPTPWTPGRGPSTTREQIDALLADRAAALERARRDALAATSPARSARATAAALARRSAAARRVALEPADVEARRHGDDARRHVVQGARRAARS